MSRFAINSTRWAVVSLLAVLALASQAKAGPIEFHDWTPTFSGGAWTYSNTSSAGTITGVTTSGVTTGFQPAPGMWGMPYAITTQPPFTSEFQIHGTTGLGASVTFNFSSGYDWGTGGQLILGNIHNYYEYTISAWDFNNNPIDVNAWTTLAEYDSTAPGTIGYFSTSNTSRAPAGLSSRFYVFDTNTDGNMGQGGVLQIGNIGQIVNVGRIQLTLTDSLLGPNAQQVDLVFFNVGTPTAVVPEPTSLLIATFTLGLLGCYRLRRRRAGSTVEVVAD